MSFITINEHLEWDIITDWFNRRAAETGVHPSQHVEHVPILPGIDSEIEKAANSLSYNLGKSIAPLLAEIEK